MKHRGFSSGGFGGNRFVEQEEADPRTGLVNLADVMLVFACGLMVALVAHYNVNLTGSEVEIDGETTEISESDYSAIEDEQGSGQSLEERGTVYEDPTTGQLYLIEKHAVDEEGEWSQEDSAYTPAEGEGQ